MKSNWNESAYSPYSCKDYEKTLPNHLIPLKVPALYLISAPNYVTLYITL